MNLIELKENEQFLAEKGSKEQFLKLRRLLNELKNRYLPESIVTSINGKLEEINATSLTGKPLQKFLTAKLTDILKQLEKELKLVPKDHFRTQWMVVGMSAFGLPFGVAFGLSLGNLAYLGLGLPFGMAIGIALGTSMDEKAKKEGRQLNLTSEE
ncbi:hypothetical protein [Algoriphagus lacus]|uniref:hypothetical protein n=1 Tax=Algoriphagus lacus TaxID=2056311 RepID=UPI0018F46058|nr:hypothetical protein [Algoriphagus lacus]